MEKLIAHIKENGLHHLEVDLGIVGKLYSDRLVLNYSQIDSPKHNPFVKKCRGLILSYPDFNILSVGFERFFNYGEDPNSKEFDISKSVCFEKIDGSYISVYHDGHNWCSSTRGTAFAESPVKDYSVVFSELFRQGLGAIPNDIFKGTDEDMVYIFELTSPFNRVVTKYSGVSIHPLLIKNRKTMIEYWKPELLRALADDIRFSKSNVRVPNVFEFNNVDEILNNMTLLKPDEEGYVCVVNGSGAPWRIKIKNPSYLALAHLRGNGGIVSVKSIIQLVITNEVGEYLSYFGEDRDLLQPYIDAYEKMKYDANYAYQDAIELTDKEVGLKYAGNPMMNVIFAKRKRGKSFTSFVADLSDDNRRRLFDRYMEN